jgi:hypothetical protein
MSPKGRYGSLPFAPFAYTLLGIEQGSLAAIGRWVTGASAFSYVTS